MGRPIKFEIGNMHGAYYSRMVDKATRRNIGVFVSAQDIYDQWVLQDGKCALTGWPLSLRTKAKDYEATASLDRIDSNAAYTRDNIQWVHKDINRLKNNFTEKRLFEMCNAVVAYKQETVKLRGSRPWIKGN